MKKTIIHVGLHKTATTFLQQSVWPTIQSYTYLSRPYTQHNYAFNQMQYADESLYNRDLILKELEQIDSERLLLSDESFSGKPIYFSYLNRSIIAKRLNDIFPEAEIVIFLRDQKDIILSHYSSYIKMPYGTKKIEDLFYKPQRNYTYSDYRDAPGKYDIGSLYYNTNDYFIHLDCFKYSPLIDVYKRLFEKCHVFLYEDFRQNRKDTIAKLGEIVGQDIEMKSSTPENVSLSYSELERRRQANRITAFSHNRYLRRLAGIALKVNASASEKAYNIRVHEIADGYYAEDNNILKRQLPYLAWQNYPGKYT